MTFHEVYGDIPTSTLRVIKRCNVSQSDWDMMLARWGYDWNSPNIPFAAVEQHITVHSDSGSYRWPMYGDEYY